MAFGTHHPHPALRGFCFFPFMLWCWGSTWRYRFSYWAILYFYLAFVEYKCCKWEGREEVDVGLEQLWQAGKAREELNGSFKKWDEWWAGEDWWELLIAPFSHRVFWILCSIASFACIFQHLSLTTSVKCFGHLYIQQIYNSIVLTQ